MISVYCFVYRSLINSFDGLATLFYNDEFVSPALKKLNSMLGDLQTFLMVRNLFAQDIISISISSRHKILSNPLNQNKLK